MKVRCGQDWYTGSNKVQAHEFKLGSWTPDPNELPQAIGCPSPKDQSVTRRVVFNVVFNTAVQNTRPDVPLLNCDRS
jgi:hypothetical protein